MSTVSVIVPAYNASRTLAEALDSVFAQEFEGKIEIIVTNDGSTDATQSVLESYRHRVQVIRQENQGLPAARNAAIRRSSGEYLAFLDADDIWLAGRLSKSIAALERNPAAVLVFSDYIRIDQSGNLVEASAVPPHLAHPPSLDEMLTHWWPIAPTTVTMRRAIWERCGGFCREARAGFEDVYLFVLAREHGRFEYLSEPLAKFRISTPDLALEKWNPKVCLRLLGERYGARAEGLVTDIQRAYAAAFAATALRAMDLGDHREALRCWLKVLRHDVFYPLRGEFFRRLLHRRNLRRLAQILRSRPSANER